MKKISFVIIVAIAISVLMVMSGCSNNASAITKTNQPSTDSGQTPAQGKLSNKLKVGDQQSLNISPKEGITLSLTINIIRTFNQDKENPAPAIELISKNDSSRNITLCSSKAISLIDSFSFNVVSLDSKKNPLCSKEVIFPKLITLAPKEASVQQVDLFSSPDTAYFTVNAHYAKLNIQGKFVSNPELKWAEDYLRVDHEVMIANPNPSVIITGNCINYTSKNFSYPYTGDGKWLHVNIMYKDVNGVPLLYARAMTIGTSMPARASLSIYNEVKPELISYGFGLGLFYELSFNYSK